jgi:hypothetical protein
MNQNNSYKEYRDINLEITLKSGVSYTGVKCSLFYVYSEKYKDCDGCAVIYFSCINTIREGNQRIDPTDYSVFRDQQGRAWKVDHYEENSPPEPPGLIFYLIHEDQA